MAPLTPPGLPSEPLFPPDVPVQVSADNVSNSHRRPSETQPVVPAERIPLREIELLIPLYKAMGPGSERLIVNIKIADLLAQFNERHPKFFEHSAPGRILLETMRYRIRLKNFVLASIDLLSLKIPENYHSFSYTHWRFHASSGQRELSDKALSSIETMRIFPAPASTREGCPFRKPKEYLTVAFATSDMSFGQVIRTLLRNEAALQGILERIFQSDCINRRDSGIAGLY